MAGLHDPASASSTSGTRSGAGFELRLERGGAYVRLADQPIAPGLRLESLTLQVPDVKFPFDVGQGAGQFRHRLADLVEASVAAEPSLAEGALGEAGLAAFGVEDVRLAMREGFLEIAGRLSGGPPFTLEAGLLPAGDQGVSLVFHSPRVLGPAPLPAAALPHLARAVLDAVGAERVPPEPLPPLLRRVLAGRGWKLPRTSEARLARAEIAGGVARLAWDRAAAGPVVTSKAPALLDAEEGARTFREAEAHAGRGEPDAAREAYLAAGPSALSHPFAAERLLSLLVVEDRFHEEALDLAAEWLSRKPGFEPALAAEAAVRLARGEEGRAARALATLAEGAAARGAIFLALAAAEASFVLAGAAREDALRAVETALGLRRDHVPALRALRQLARAAGDREALLRANRRLVAYDPDPASKARAHAELGELLLEADPPGARLHLDHALRLAPDDADALSALARACSAAGEPLRAVRAVDRLRELFLARGDAAAAARAAVEAGALWEDPLGHAENALLRYREACELSPSAERHALAARAAERAGQWAEAADHHAAVLARLDLATPGAPALAVRARLALADVAERRLADPAGAVAHLEAAAALGPSDAALLRRLVALQRDLGRPAGLAAALERLAAAEPEATARAALLAEAGETALALGRVGDARSRFAAAIAADGACRPALLGLARLARERGDAGGERDALVRLLPLATGPAEIADVQDRLADACERAGDLAGAVAAAQGARELAPTPARLDAALRLVRRSGDASTLAALLAERARAAQAAGDAAAATDALLERARLLAPQQPALALAALAEARATSPGDGGVLRAQAELAERGGDPRLALGALRALLSSAPPDAPALDLRAARAALDAGETPAAREHAERALDRGVAGAAAVLDEILDRSGDDATRGEVLTRLGRHLEAARLFERHGDAARARAALERAVDDPATAPQALPRLAELRLAEGDGAGAAAALLALARGTAGAEGARLALRAHALGGDPAALDVALERDPSSGPARARRAELRAGDDPRAALADAEAALGETSLPDEERPALLALATRVAAACGDLAAARRHLGAYCDATAEDDAALARLAALHRAAGARADLARTLERRLDLATGDDGAAVRLELSELLLADDPARAARLAREALELEPRSLAALRALAAEPRARHVPGEERAGLLARLAAHPEAAAADAAAAQATRARLLSDAGDPAGALEAARDAARLGPEDDAALELRAALAARAGAAAEAAGALLLRAGRAADAGDPSAAERLAEAGLAALAADVPGAEDALRRARALGPGRESARVIGEALARLARERGDERAEEDALAPLVPLLPTGARPAALLRLAALALGAGDAARARASAEEARALAPRDPVAVEACRAAAQAQGDLARVAALLAELAELEPADAGPRLLERARLCASLGDAAAADGAYAAALRLLPPDRALADEHVRHRRDALGGRGVAQPLEAFAARAADAREAARALRVAAAAAQAAGDGEGALRCARRAYARTQDDLAFAAPLLARLLYLRGGGAEALVLHRRLLEAGFPGLAPAECLSLCRQAAELAEDAGERDLALAAYDRLLALRPQELDAALRRFALDPDRGRAARDLAAAAIASRARRGQALALARAADAALRETPDRDLADALFARAAAAAASVPRLAAEVARARAQSVRAADGPSSATALAALHDAAAAAEAAADRAATRELLEQAVAVARERGLLAEAAHDLLQLDALAAADGDFAASGARVRAAAALLREAGDLAGAAEALRRAYAQDPESLETARQLEETAGALGAAGAPLLVELRADRAARTPAGAGRAAALVALADAQLAAGAPARAEAALRAALEDAPGHAAAEDRLLALLARDARGPRLGESAALLASRARRASGELRAAGLRDAARALFEAGEEDRARALLREAFDAFPADGAAFAEALRDASADLERVDAVLRARAAAVPAEAAACHRARADALQASGETERAIAAYQATCEADPLDLDAIASLAGCLAAARGDDAARALDARVVAGWEAAPALVSAAAEAPSRYRLGLALVREGLLVDALPHLERAVVLAPSHARAAEGWAAVARAHALRGDIGAALAAARVRVNRAAALGLAAELEVALADERAIAEGLGVPVPPGPAALYPPPPPPVAAAEVEEAVGEASTSTSTATPIELETSVDASAAPLALDPADLPAGAAEALAAEPPADAGAGAAPLATEQPEPAEPPDFAAEPEEGISLAQADEDPTAQARAAAERAVAATEPAARAAAWVEAAEALVGAGASWEDARGALELACEADPDAAAPWRARARLEGSLGDPLAAARAHLSVSIRTEGEEAAAAALEAARLFAGAGRHGDAARAYRAALHARPGAVSADVVGAQEALAAGDAALAADRLSARDLSALAPEARAAHLRSLAHALAAAGRIEAARGMLLAALELEPAHPETRAALAALDGRADDWARLAAALWDEAAATTDAAEAAAVFLRLARILSDRLGDEGGAVAALRGALDRARSASTPSALRSAAEAEVMLAALGSPAGPASEPAPEPAPEPEVEAELPPLELSDLLLPEDAPPQPPDLDAGSGATADLAVEAPLVPEAPLDGAPPLDAEAPVEAEAGAESLDAVAAVLRDQIDATEGPERADHLERLAAHLERGGDVEGAAEALARAIEADPHRDATWSWLLALAPDDEARVERARAARASAEAEVSFAASGEEGDAGAGSWEVSAAQVEDLSLENLSLEGFPLVDAPPEAISFESLPGDAAPEVPPDLFAEAPADLSTEPPPEPPAGLGPDSARELAEPLAAPDAAGPGADSGPELVPPAGPAGEEPAEELRLAAAETTGEAPEDAPVEPEPPEAAISFEAAAEESRLPPLPSHDPAEYARDGRRRMEAGDFGGAYERLSIALAREPADLTVARDLGRVTEQLGLFDEYVQLGELCADAIAAYDPLAAAARFRHFADVLRDRLGLVDRAGVMLEKALALAPDDADTRRELVRLWSSDEATAPRALETWLEIARRDPTDAAALAGAADVSARLAAAARDPAAAARHGERARIAASLAAFVSPGVLPAPEPARLAAHVPAELRARVAAPGATGPLARLVRLLAPWLEPLFPADLARRGASLADRVDAARAPALTAALEEAGRALWARSHATFVGARPGLELSLENTQPPAVIATAAVAALPGPALAFLAARVLDLLDHGWALAGKFAPRDVAILLELACRFAGGAPPSLGLPRERAGAFLKVLAAQVPPAARAAAAELAAAAADELGETDPRSFTAALRRTANRVALLYAGDPGAALAALAQLDGRLQAGPLDVAQALALPDLRDLALFALSEPFLDLRVAVLG